MKLPRISTFPLDKPFKKLEPMTPLSEAALRLVENIYTDAPMILGTATVLCGNLAVTAKHVFEEIQNRDAGTRSVSVDKHISAVQVLPGPEYIIWDVVEATADPMTDIALLHLGTNPRRSDPEKPHQWRQPLVNPFAPNVGERIAAFGYRKSVVKVSKNAHGGNHIELDDEPMASVGVVREVFEWRRDVCSVPWPCYQVSARFDSGMSGGPVFDETGCFCGLVSSSFDGSHLDGEPVSYVTTLWPLFRLIISQDRAGNLPRGVRYPAIELARTGLIAVPDLSRLEQWFSEHVGPEADTATGTGRGVRRSGTRAR
jgi:hypothetical protein